MKAKSILVLSLALAFSSCKKSNPGPIVSTSVYLEIRNTNGVDLLDPVNANAILPEDIDVYVLKDGDVKARLYQSNLDRPEFFHVFKAEKNYAMRLLFDYTKNNIKNDQVVQYIRYKDGSEDKLTGIFNKDRSQNVLIQKVYVNDVLKWDAATPQTALSPVLIIK